MSLRKKPTRTDKRVAARQADERHSHGFAPLEGRDWVPVTDLAPSSFRMMLVMRMEDSNGRQDGRITNLLWKAKSHQRQMEVNEKGDERRPRFSRDMLENKGVIF